MTPEAASSAIVVFAPAGRDGPVIGSILKSAGHRVRRISSFSEALEEIEESAALVVTEEAFAAGDPAPVLDWIENQPSWSDLPVIFLRSRSLTITGQTGQLIDRLGNVTLLERPLHPITLVSAARGAVRARRRQKETETLLAERLQAADTLRESETRFRLMADSAPALIWTSDAQGRPVYFNRAFEAVLGAPVADGPGRELLPNIHPQDRERFRRSFRAAVRGRKKLRSEVRAFDRSGAVIWLCCEAAPRFKGREFVGHVGCNVDITDAKLAAEELERRVSARTSELAAANRELIEQIEGRERVEEALRQSQRLEAVGQLTAGVAHDFNNLLTVVLGSVEHLERYIEDQGLVRRLGMMRTAAERGAKLTAQLLAFSRRQKLEPKPVNLNDTVAGMRDLLHSTMGGSVRLETVLEQDLWPALVDPTQIELIILNLAINARDAMEVGGSLMVETFNETVREARARPQDPSQGDYVVVAVTDTGSGMDDATLAKAFEPFFTTKPVGKGSGLGLSQVLGFAQQSGGGVRIETRTGHGTSVKVYLPRSAALAPPPEAAKARRTRTNGSRSVLILVVDDDSAVREITAQLLTEQGYAVLEAGTGGAALRLLEQHPEVNLLVLDFAMPGMNGLEVAREASSRRHDLPIVFVTGYADLTALADIGEDRIVHKPFRDGELVQKVTRALGVAAERGSRAGTSEQAENATRH